MQYRYHFAAVLCFCAGLAPAQTPLSDTRAGGQKAAYIREIAITRACLQEELGSAWAAGIRDPQQLRHRMTAACGKILQVLAFDNFGRKDLSPRIDGVVAYLAWDELRQTPGIQAGTWTGMRPCVSYECVTAPIR